jgi:sulfur relay (sulfurtransferase) complex TusBCD TusD component (DsrE family)
MSEVDYKKDNIVAAFTLSEAAAVLIEKKDAVYVLRWNDGVVNEWSESYPSLSVALARAAVLAACGEANWERGFANDPETFSKLANLFLKSEVQ